MTKRPLGVQISQMLKDRGVDVVFGIPGVHNIELYRGIGPAGITHVLARHEQGAGFMADGYARATGKPGVAFVITGPGLTNIMTPMGQAYSDSVPVLVISSCLRRGDLGMGRGRLHEMRDQQGAAAAVCDWSKTALDAKAAFQLIARAMEEFAIARPRPKHIQIPIDVLGADADPAARAHEISDSRVGMSAEPMQVVAMLNSAKRPLFIFGGGAVSASPQARQVVEICGGATMLTYAGRGIIPSSDRLNFGPCLAQPGSVAVIASADLVVAIGTTLSETDLWRDNLGHESPLIRVDIDPEVLVDMQRAEVPVHADAQAFLSAVLPHLISKPAGWTASEVSAARHRFAAETDAARPGIMPVLAAMRAVLPDEALIYSDMTQLAYVGKEIYALEKPGLWHHPYGYGTLGYGLPAAIGGKIGAPDRPVVAIVGDYGFHYTLQELGVAVEMGLALPIILWDNGKLKEIEDSMINSQIAPNSVIARNPDFCALARAFGANSAAPKSLDEFGATLRAALAADGPTLIHATPDMVPD